MTLGIIDPKISLKIAFADKAEELNSLYKNGDKNGLKSKVQEIDNAPEVMSIVWDMLKPEVQKELKKLGYNPEVKEANK